MTKEQIRMRLNEVTSRLNKYYAAENAILEGAQSYQIGSRQITRATIFRVQEEIARLETKKTELENALHTGSLKNRAIRVLYRDL